MKEVCTSSLLLYFRELFEVESLKVKHYNDWGGGGEILKSIVLFKEIVSHAFLLINYILLLLVFIYCFILIC